MPTAVQPLNCCIFLNNAGVGLALPLLESCRVGVDHAGAVRAAGNAPPPIRMVHIGNALGFYGPACFLK